MKELFGFDGGFINGCSMLFDLFVLGLLWILCSLPVVTIGASSAALYYAVVKSVKKRNGYAAREFFRSFRCNLVPGIFLTVIVLAVTFVLQLNIGILNARTDSYVGLFFICVYVVALVYVALAACYLFPALSRFAMGPGWLLKLSLYMVVKYLGTSVVLALIVVSAGAFIFRIPMLLFVLPGPAVWLISEFMERVLKKHEPEDSADGA